VEAAGWTGWCNVIVREVAGGCRVGAAGKEWPTERARDETA
jgi:hypothetical protein